MDIDHSNPSSIAERFYRLLLHCFPPRFRAEAEGELIEWFRQSWPIVRKSGPAARARFWAALLLDLRSAPAEWLSLSAFSFSSPSHRSPGATPVETFVQDLRYALRSFRTAPAATLITALTIAIGIGATTTILSVANALRLRPPAGVVDTGSLVKVFNFGGREGAPTTVVGLARNAKYRSVGEDPVSMVFLPFAQQSSRSISLVVRMAPGAPDPSRGFREVVRALDPALPIARIALLTQVIGVALLPNRVALGLAVLFGATGLLLAAVGLYGVLSFMVSRRRREIGIRMALGAAAQNVRRLVLGDGLRLVAIGLSIGLVSAALVTRLLRTFLFGVSPLDPTTYGSIALLFGAVGVVACLVPMRRALRTEPLEVLRHD